MTEPLTPDQVTDLISGEVASWSGRKLDTVERLEMQIAEFHQNVRLFGEAVDRVTQQAIEFAKAYRRANNR